MSTSADSSGTPASGFSRDLARADRRVGPRVVAFGGGTGMSMLLQGLKEYTGNITAVVTVTDNGGSSGRLRNDFDIVPPGDIRNCLVALADVDPLITRMLQYRFDESEFKGHCFGNLFITVLARIVGNFEGSISELNRLLRVKGRVIPAAGEKVSLVAHHPDGTKSTGEVQITRSRKPIERIELRPAPVPLSAEIRAAVRVADLFLFGPGSLFTSVIPNLLLEDLMEEIRANGSPQVYISNLMTQSGETDEFRLSDHIRALRRHVGRRFPHYVVAHEGELPENVLSKYRAEGAEPVVVDTAADGEFADVRLILRDFFSGGETARHDPALLARTLHEEFLKPIAERRPLAPRETVGATIDGGAQRSAPPSDRTPNPGPASSTDESQVVGDS